MTVGGGGREKRELKIIYYGVVCMYYTEIASVSKASA
jgi:hypothetical protein